MNPEELTMLAYLSGVPDGLGCSVPKQRESVARQLVLRGALTQELRRTRWGRARPLFQITSLGRQMLEAQP